MTASTEQERAAHIAYEAGVPLNFSMHRNGPVGAFTLTEFLKLIDSAVEYGARRAPEVLHGWALVPIEASEEMLCAACGLDGDDWEEDHASCQGLIDDMRSTWAGILAAAPQPPEGLMSENRTSKPEAKGSVSNGTLVAPVQLPEPVLYVSPGQLANHTDLEYPDSGRYIPARKTQAGNFTCGLLTKQQVRQLLAAAQEQST